MSRYRPPRPKSSPYITRQGYNWMVSEEQRMWAWRTEVCEALSVAAAEGGSLGKCGVYLPEKNNCGRSIVESDSFSAEYRISSGRFLPMTRRGFFGAWVELERESGERQILRIVGPDEFDQDKRYISMDSPMGKSFWGNDWMMKSWSALLEENFQS